MIRLFPPGAVESLGRSFDICALVAGVEHHGLDIAGGGDLTVEACLLFQSPRPLAPDRRASTAYTLIREEPAAPALRHTPR